MNQLDIDQKSKLFKKTIPQNKFQTELEMSNLAITLSESSAFFKTPKISSVFPKKNQIHFELLENVLTLREYYVQSSKFGTTKEMLKHLNNLFYKIGQSIFKIHTTKTETAPIQLKTFPEGFFPPTFNNDQVLIHGDFTMRNILYKSDDNDLYIIDWNTSPVYNFSANLGPRYWDLSFFISSLFFFSFTTFFSYRSKVELCNTFLSGYLNASSLKEDDFLKNLSKFMKEYNYYILYKDIHRERAGILNKILLKRTIYKLNLFLSDLSKLR